MEELLVDVPPAQRELLRRQMTAMKSRGKTGPQTDGPEIEQLAQTNSSRSKSAAATRRITDSENEIKPQTIASNNRSQEPDLPEDLTDGTASYVGSTKYSMAATSPNRSDEGQIKPRAVERPYTRNLSDKQQPPQSSREQPLVEHAPRKTAAETNPVVMASHSEKRPVDRDASGIADDELTWREHLHHALAQLEQEPNATSPEEQVHRAMVDRLLHLSLGDINSASEPIDGLQTHGQDFIRHSLESLYEVANPSGNPVEIKRYSLAMLSQRKALSHLAAVSNLEVHNATFCTEVDGYGVVTKFPQYAFKADQELLLYCELDNFVSSHIDGKGFETQLQGSYEIVDASGRRVADQLLPMDSHLCRNQRRDYFIAYRIYMPPKIDPGKYQLKLTVEDLKGRKFGQANLDFQISQ